MGDVFVTFEDPWLPSPDGESLMPTMTKHVKVIIPSTHFIVPVWSDLIPDGSVEDRVKERIKSKLMGFVKACVVQALAEVEEEQQKAAKAAQWIQVSTPSNKSHTLKYLLPPPTHPVLTALSQLFGDDLSALVACPEKGPDKYDCVREDDTLFQMVQHLNDDHEWSREKIADWVEELDLDLTLKE